MIYLPSEATHPLGPDSYAFTSADFGQLPTEVVTFGWWTRWPRPKALTCARCGRVAVLVDGDFNLVLADPAMSERPVCDVCGHETARDLAEFAAVYQGSREAGHAWTIRVPGCVPLVVMEDRDGVLHTVLLRREDVERFVAAERVRARRGHPA